MFGYLIPHFCYQTHNEFLLTTDSSEDEIQQINSFEFTMVANLKKGKSLRFHWLGKMLESEVFITYLTPK